MRKFGLLFVFLSVGLFILCAASPVFCDSLNAESMPYDSNQIGSDDEMVLEATSDEELTTDVTKKTGTLTIINSSIYCATVNLDSRMYYDLPAGKTGTITKVPYGYHTFLGKECNAGSHYWGPLKYKQGAAYTITLK